MLVAWPCLMALAHDSVTMSVTALEQAGSAAMLARTSSDIAIAMSHRPAQVPWMRRKSSSRSGMRSTAAVGR